MKSSQLRAAARRLFGDGWKSPLARVMGYGYVAIYRMELKDQITRVFELALVGVEAIRAGFRPSWWSDADVQRFNDSAADPKPKPKAKRRVAIQVRPPA